MQGFIELVTILEERGVVLCLVNPNNSNMHKIIRSGLAHKLETQAEDADTDWIFCTVADAVRAVHCMKPQPSRQGPVVSSSTS